VVEALIAELDTVCAGLPDQRKGPRRAGDYGMADIGLSAFSLFFMGSPSFLEHQRALDAQRKLSEMGAPLSAQSENPLQHALKIAAQAADECRNKRLSGQLPSHVASVQCANPRMLQAFNAVHYRYMDLIQFFAAKRLEMATKIDRGEMTEQQAQTETEKIYASMGA